MKTDIEPDDSFEFDATSLDSLPGIIWKLLEEGARKASSPFHTPALASVGEIGPDARTVVLRHADSEARQIICHTDWRSSKRFQIERDPRICWNFCVN